MKTKQTMTASGKSRSSEMFPSDKEYAEFNFGEACVRVKEVDVNSWQCMVGDHVIGFVKYMPSVQSGYEYGSRTHGFSGYNSMSLDDADNHPATEINRYSCLRNAVQAVTAKHFSGKTYTYIAQSIAILDGKVVQDAVFKGRKVIKSSLV